MGRILSFYVLVVVPIIMSTTFTTAAMTTEFTITELVTESTLAQSSSTTDMTTDRRTTTSSSLTTSEPDTVTTAGDTSTTFITTNPSLSSSSLMSTIPSMGSTLTQSSLISTMSTDGGTATPSSSTTNEPHIATTAGGTSTTYFTTNPSVSSSSLSSTIHSLGSTVAHSSLISSMSTDGGTATPSSSTTNEPDIVTTAGDTSTTYFTTNPSLSSSSLMSTIHSMGSTLTQNSLISTMSTDGGTATPSSSTTNEPDIVTTAGDTSTTYFTTNPSLSSSSLMSTIHSMGSTLTQNSLISTMSTDGGTETPSSSTTNEPDIVTTAGDASTTYFTTNPSLSSSSLMSTIHSMRSTLTQNSLISTMSTDGGTATPSSSTTNEPDIVTTAGDTNTMFHTTNPLPSSSSPLLSNTYSTEIYTDGETTIAASTPSSSPDTTTEATTMTTSASYSTSITSDQSSPSSSTGSGTPATEPATEANITESTTMATESLTTEATETHTTTMATESLTTEATETHTTAMATESLTMEATETHTTTMATESLTTEATEAHTTKSTEPPTELSTKRPTSTAVEPTRGKVGPVPEPTFPDIDEDAEKTYQFEFAVEEDTAAGCNSSDLSSDECERFKYNITQELEDVYKESTGFKSVEVGLRVGSLIVNHTVIYTYNDMSEEDKMAPAHSIYDRTLGQAVVNEKLGNYTVIENCPNCAPPEETSNICYLNEPACEPPFSKPGCKDNYWVCESICDTSYCNGNGICWQGDDFSAPICSCDWDNGEWYWGYKCQFYANQMHLIIGCSCGAAVLLVLIVSCVVYLCTRTYHKSDKATAVSSENGDDVIHAFRNLGYDQDHTTETANFPPIDDLDEGDILQPSRPYSYIYSGKGDDNANVDSTLVIKNQNGGAQRESRLEVNDDAAAKRLSNGSSDTKHSSFLKSNGSYQQRAPDFWGDLDATSASEAIKLEPVLDHIDVHESYKIQRPRISTNYSYSNSATPNVYQSIGSSEHETQFIPEADYAQR